MALLPGPGQLDPILLPVRRVLLPIVLGLLALSSALAAVRVGPSGERTAVAAEAPPLADAPVLSARRVPGLLARTAGDRRLSEALDVVWAASPGASCLVVSQGERGVYERQVDQVVVPASAAKLLTAVAVLRHLDVEDRLRTTVVATEPASGGVLEGDLWLVGGGDPLLGTQPWAASFEHQPALYSPLELLADRVAEAGVRVVRGRVIGDDDRYDETRYVTTWPARYVTENQTGPLSALSVNDGFSAWEPAVVPFADPAAGAATVLTDLLRQRGVQVDGEAGSGSSPGGAVEVAALASARVGELVSQMLRESDNGTAELLVKELGLVVRGEGSTAAGIAAVADALAALGLPTTGAVIADGSGLDRGNRLNCRLIQAVLSRAEPGGPLDAGLAVAGRTGTLTERFLAGPVGGRLRAKTGTLEGVTALAGYAEVRLGQALTFAYVANGIASTNGGFALQDQLADSLVRYPDLPDVDQLGPSSHPAAA